MRTVAMLIFVFVTPMVFSQEASPDTSWKAGGAVGLNISQVSLKNWAAGGENSLATNGLVTLFAKMKKDKIAWDNTLDVGYGIVKQGKNSLRKSDDKLVLTSKFGREAVGYWSYSVLLDFRTQFAKGYDFSTSPKTLISKFMAPGYLTLSLGAEYKPNDKFFALISPVTGKATFVTDDTLSAHGAFGVKPGKKSLMQFGWQINSVYKTKVMDGVDFQTKLNLFGSYNDIKHVVVNWENLLLLKVNKVISSSVSTQLIKDHNVKDANGKSKIQFKEVIAVGLLYNF
jgi:hypothetical protein